MVGTASNYSPMKMMMKRKEIDLDEVSDDFHDFSLSSPARKIRRLNSQLPPIMEEEREPESLPVGSSPIIEDGVVSEMVSVCDPVNEERAIVLYKPRIQSSPRITVNLGSLNLVSGFKNQILQASQSARTRLVEDEDSLRDENNATHRCLAVVPWVPSQFPLASTAGIDAPQTEATDLMEADNMEATAMDVEDNNNSSIGQGHAYDFGAMRDHEGLAQWPQHCMIPQLPQSTSTPVTWFQ